jgi:filamentous hemagglutinin family protein
MNCSYRSIWNDKTGTFVAASENTASHGKKTSSCIRTARAGSRFTLQALAVSVMLAFGANGYAGPTGGVVTSGSASITSGTSSTTIKQSTQNAAINWQSFNIASGESVRFVQPNSNSVTLNRVLGSDPSSILGSLSANGKVFLVNPNGVLFGQGASVNVGGLVASTLNVTDSDFMAGSYKFAGSGNGAVVNQGSINADGGYVALLGANVANNGVISARLGSVALAAGNAMTLDVAGDGLLNVAVNQGVVNALVQNGGLIQADGGQVLLTARSAASLLQSAVNNTGVIQAQTLQNHKGVIKLMGDMQSGTVNVGGKLDVSGAAMGQTGGNVTVTGHHVGLFSGHIDASGDAGGGTVLIGGGYQGKNTAVENASATYMSADSTIGADAITNGNGGTAVLWSTDSTRAYGSISARGGALGGNGGLIETSGHWLDVAGINVNASAPSGSRGMWLLDPADVTITAATVDATLSAGVFSPDSGVNAATVNVATLQTTLGVGGAGTDVTITTTNTGAAGVPLIGLGNITVASVISWSPTTPTTLTLNAAGDVNINAAVTAVGGNFVACCGRDVNVNAPITTTNGSVLLSAGRDVNIIRTAALTGITTTDGNIAICAGNDINLGNSFNPGGSPLITLTTGSVTVGESLATLGVTRGLTLSAGNAGTGPGAAGGTVIFTNGGPSGTFLATTGPDPVTPTNIYYNPSAYTLAGSTDYSTFFTGTGGPLTQYMLVFPGGADKTYDGTPTATFTGLKGSPAGVTLAGAGTAFFDTANAGTNKTITFSGFTLAQAPIVTGGTATNFALPITCCAPIVSRTTATIAAAPLFLIVTASDVTKPYGQTVTLTDFTSVGLQGGETIGLVTLTSPGTPASANVATYAITASDARGGTFIPGNYTISYVDGKLAVTPIPLVLTANDATKVYGTTFTPAGTAFTKVGLVNSDTVTSVVETSTGSASTASVAGSTYPIVITPGSATGSFTATNYTISYVDGKLAVTPAPLVLTANDATKVYGTTFTPAGTAFSMVGLVNSDTVTSVVETSTASAPTASVAGSTYPIVITPGSATGSFTPTNYVITYADGKLTVTPIPLTVKANDVSKTYGQTPALTGFTTTPLANGETVGSVTETSPGQVATASVAGSPYAITASNAGGGTFTPGNYTIDYVNGVLSVTPALVPPPVTPTYIAPPVTPVTWVPVIAPPRLPPQLLTIAPPVAPPVLLVVAPPERPVVVQEAPPVVQPVTPPAVYVAPHHPRKQDRN